MIHINLSSYSIEIVPMKDDQCLVYRGLDKPRVKVFDVRITIHEFVRTRHLIFPEKEKCLSLLLLNAPK